MAVEGRPCAPWALAALCVLTWQSHALGQPVESPAPPVVEDADELPATDAPAPVEPPPPPAPHVEAPKHGSPIPPPSRPAPSTETPDAGATPEAPSTRGLERGEWYVPGPLDRALKERGHDPWHGRYFALEARYEGHFFLSDKVEGAGASFLGRLDLSELFGFHGGVYVPGGAIMAGMHLFGNMRYELVDFDGLDASLGVVFPEVSVSTALLFDPLEVLLRVGLQIAGLRMVVGDTFQLTVRGGLPSIWVSAPQLGSVVSGGLTVDVGTNF